MPSKRFQGNVAGDNVPYSGQLYGDTLYRHGTARGLAHVLIEVRQDLILAPEGQAEWGDRLAEVFRNHHEDEELASELHRVQPFGSSPDEVIPWISWKTSVLAVDAAKCLRISSPPIPNTNNSRTKSVPTSARDQLRTIVARIERLEEEKAALASDLREVYLEAKGNGFGVKPLRAVIRIQKQDADKRKEEEAVLDTYLHALDIAETRRRLAFGERGRARILAVGVGSELGRAGSFSSA